MDAAVCDSSDMNAITKLLVSSAAASPAGDAIQVPSLESVSPAYVALVAKQSELSAENIQLRERIHDKISSFAKLTQSAIRNEPRPTPLSKKIAEILGDDPPQEPTHASEFDSISALEQRSRDIEAAMEVVNERLEIERRKASVIICDQLEPTHRQLVANIAARIVELQAAVAAYESFGDALNDRRVLWSSLWPMHCRFAAARDHRSYAAVWLHEAANRGFVPKSAIPDSWR